jgi:TolB protein
MDEQSEIHTPRRRWWLAGCLLLVAGCIVAATVALSQWWPATLALESVGLVRATAVLPTEAPAAVVEAEIGGVATGTAPARPAGRALTGSRIAFVDREGRLGTVNADGSDERMLTGGGTVLLFPAWSPDGRQLAAVGSTQDGPGVFAVDDRAGTEMTTLYLNRDGAPIYLYWSPSGEEVSFIANHEDGLGLYLAAASGTEAARLLATGAPFYWHWAEDGEELLIHTGANAPGARLAFLDVSAGEPGDDLAPPGFFQAPGISAGGRYLAWAEVDEDGTRWLVVKEGNNPDDLRLPHRGSVAMSWSPDRESSLLAFVSPAAPVNQPAFSHYGPLRLLDAASGEIEVLAQQVVLAFFWSPDGHYIAYITLGAADEGMQAATRPVDVAFSRRSRGAAQHEEVQLALWIVDVDTGLAQQRLVFHPTAIYLTQFLPFFDQYALSHNVWAPDGSALVLPVGGDTSREDKIYVVPVGDGSPFAVADGNIAFWSP